MTFHIYYRASDGEIFGWSTSHVPTAPPGLALAFVEEAEPDPATQKLDLETLTVIDKTPAEIRASRLPTLRQVQEAIYRELVRTDALMIPDYPLTPPRRHAWQAYRQMLRDLSKLDGPAAMVAAWTLPPDGVDPIIDLRERSQP